MKIQSHQLKQTWKVNLNNEKTQRQVNETYMKLAYRKFSTQPLSVFVCSYACCGQTVVQGSK